MITRRMLQLGEQIRELIATMLVRGQISDPRLAGITINSVKMSPDLQMAKVYFSIFGDEEKRTSAQKALKNASGYIRRELGKLLKIRYIPALFFYFDESVEYSIKMTSLLTSVRSELLANEQQAPEQTDSSSIK